MKPALLSAALILLIAPVARAQYYPPNPYYPYYPGSPVGNALQGQASVISATGDLMTSQEQARIMREQANQAKIVTKKKTFDEMLYEKAMTPTFTEEMNKNQSMLLRRVMTNPTEIEVTTGKAQNIILPTLNRVALKGAYGPPIPLDQDMLKHINVSGSGSDGSGVGMLKNGGTDITWPIAVVGTKAQKKMAELIPVGVSEAKMGQLSLATYNKINSASQTLSDELTQKFRKEEIDGGLYLDGKRFMESLSGSLKLLRSPSAADYFNGNYAAKGRTVLELVGYMSTKGLKFAPCDPGFEAPYFALYTAMVAYASGHGEDPSGFVSLNAAKYPQKNPKAAWK